MTVKSFLTSGLTSLCVLLTGCGNTMNKNETEFEWHATESGPEHYPMEIRDGTFYYKGQGNGLYIPTGATLRSGWGEMRSTHITGPRKKPLPDRVDVTFISYTENQIYHGRFDLPYEKILALFREAHLERPDNPYYDGIMVGVAPGGAVSVWLKGVRTKEIFFGQAEKVGPNLNKPFVLPLDSDDEVDAYAKAILVDTLKPEEQASLRKNGIPFGTWARYRKLYKWVPSYTAGKISSDKEMVASYINGERYLMPTILTEEMANTPRPLPKELKFYVTVGNVSAFYIINFEEFELMEAFEKLSVYGEKVYIEFDAQLPRQFMKIRVHNGKDSIDLKKVHIKE